MADNGSKGAEPHRRRLHRLQGSYQMQPAPGGLAMARQIERDNTIAGIAKPLDQRAHELGTRTPTVDKQHGAEFSPARLRLKFVCSEDRKSTRLNSSHVKSSYAAS